MLLTGGERKGWGNIYLYFGCRKSTIDNIYKQELEQAKQEGVIKEVYTALSREPDQPKVINKQINVTNGNNGIIQ